jgi:hypothetical protein
MSKEQARFVVGGVYRRKRVVGGLQYGVLVDGLEEANGRRHGRIFAGGETSVGVTERDMQDWELIAEPGNPIIPQGTEYVRREDLAKQVEERLAVELSAWRDRFITLEKENVDLRVRLSQIERDLKPEGKTVPIMERARA